MFRQITLALMIALAAIGCAPTGANPFIPPAGIQPAGQVAAPSGAVQSPAGVQPAGQVAAPSGAQSTGVAVATPGSGFRTPFTAPNSQPDAISGRRTRLGQNFWGGDQLENLKELPTLGANEAYLAHGDVEGNGTCRVWYWTNSKPSKPPLSNATWQLYHIQASSQQALIDAVAVEQQIASKGAPETCPVTKKG